MIVVYETLRDLLDDMLYEAISTNSKIIHKHGYTLYIKEEENTAVLTQCGIIILRVDISGYLGNKQRFSSLQREEDDIRVL